ncbi:MAG TPA: GntR family transcriptional regulator [Paracoccaceae bacterium]|mgnify:CR=1 FL=1|nr:GntR family transcriptional regulator [Paracoccaceae bacterium]HMO71722.1 GntR family transcriptional regulator [Paracoccaceae bacterium]
MSGWQEIRDDLRRRIAAREWPPGATIPGEETLAADYAAARATVNRALRELAVAGLVERRRKAGTRVTQGAPRRAVLSIPVLRAEVEAAGKAHSFHILALREGVPPEAVRARLGANTPGRMFAIDTLHRADGAAFALERRWLNPAAVPGPMPDLTRVTVNEWLLSTLPYAEGEIVFSAEAAGPEEARHLGCATGAALFCVERVTRTGAVPVTWVRLFHAPGYRLASPL